MAFSKVQVVVRIYDGWHFAHGVNFGELLTLHIATYHTGLNHFMRNFIGKAEGKHWAGGLRVVVYVQLYHHFCEYIYNIVIWRFWDITSIYLINHHQKGHHPGQLWQIFIAEVDSFMSLLTCSSTVSCLFSWKSVPLNLCFTRCKAFTAFSFICCIFSSDSLARRGDYSIWFSLGSALIYSDNCSIMLPIISSWMFRFGSMAGASGCFLSFVSLQLIIGSCAKVYSTPKRLSLLSRKIFITISQVTLKRPWIPGMPIAFWSMRVRRKGTFSGNFYLRTATSKQSPKSICTMFPEYRWSMILEGWRSPSPKM